MQQESNQKPIDNEYQQALKAFRAEWAGRRAQARKDEQAKANAEAKEADKETARNALKCLQEIKGTQSKKELACVVKRLEMFINGEKYTRKGGETK